MNNAVPYTPEETSKAIKQSKTPKALGPDGISNVHLKQLGPAGIQYLTHIFNLSISTSQLPSIWKTSIIIPLPKPGKEPSESTSYRPVSLLCPAVKCLERLILPTLKEHLDVPDFQHGFRSKHSTVSALNDLNQDISDGFNQKKPPSRTLLLQIDMSKAFDMVNHDKLLKDLNRSSLPPFLKRWMNCYLHGRQSRVMFRNKTSSTRNVKTGVPQGAVTSPILFNFYLCNLPLPPDGIRIIQYADDISIYCFGPHINPLCDKINRYINAVTSFLEERELVISPEKSTVTLFSPDPAEYKTRPNIQIKDQQIRLDKTPKLLGITFDTMHTFSNHVKTTITKCNSKLNILKALAGTSWGQDKETMIITYKSICRSILEYATPIWSPSISDTNWEKLQVIQNKALRIATGCYNKASPSHLHQECKMLPVREHCEMITKQYLAACHLPGHPGRKHLGRPPAPRPKKLTLLDRHKTELSNLIPNPQDFNEMEYKIILKSIHTQDVAAAIASLKPNRVLGTPPPEINKEETKLNRKARARLAQLRSGFSNILMSFKNICDPEIENKCPKCNITPHDTQHLFQCAENPTNLSTVDLWTNPIQVSNFLQLEHEDDEQAEGQADNGG